MRSSCIFLSTLAALALAIVVAACGSGQPGHKRAGATTASGASTTASRSQTAAPQAHPQAVEPTPGLQADSGDPAAAPTVVGDVNAHAPSLAQVKRELKQLNLCGGVTDSAEASPLVKSGGPGFTPDPGTQQTEGQLPVLTARLDQLGKALGVTIYGISGYRTPGHSVAVGGYADDPHTRGEAEDIGVGSLLRSSAAQITEAQLARFGLYRPFDPSGDPNNTEVNHIQLIPSGGPLSLAVASSTFEQDPLCNA
jgi:hypothetical protein